MVVIDNFSKLGFTRPLENKNAQTKTNSFEYILLTSKRKTNFMKTDRGEEFCNGIFQKSLSNENIKHYSINSSSVSVFAERFNRTIRDLLKRPVFERGDGN